jgi:TRAP-type C4-dicarboxylate transport system permease large subunit
MLAGLLLTSTIGFAGWSLWCRRHTWHAGRYQVGATVMVALMAVAVFLISPASPPTVGALLHWATGRWSVDRFLADLFSILSLCALLYHALLRIESDDNGFARKYERLVARPLVVALPVLFALFWSSRTTQHYHSGLLDPKSADGWMRAYFLSAYMVYVYMLGYAARLFLVLRDAPRSRRVALIYFWGSVFAILAEIRYAISMLTGWGYSKNCLSLWILISIAVILFVYGAAQSWQQRDRQSKPAPDQSIPLA